MIVRAGLCVILLFAAVGNTGCLFSRKFSDNSSINYAEKNTQLIREMAEHALLFSITHNNTNYFSVDSIPDKDIRKKMQNIGNTIEIIYRMKQNYSSKPEPLDSVVTFKFITLLGVKEIIYDFAARKRNYDSSNQSDYLFVKVADRIYYRRRPVPIM